MCTLICTMVSIRFLCAYHVMCTMQIHNKFNEVCVSVTQQQNKYFPYDRICPIPNYNNGLTSRWSQQPRLPRCSYQLILVECSSVPPIPRQWTLRLKLQRDFPPLHFWSLYREFEIFSLHLTLDRKRT